MNYCGTVRELLTERIKTELLGIKHGDGVTVVLVSSSGESAGIAKGRGAR